MNAESVDTAGQALPRWRLISGIAVFVAMITVLASLAPVYLENFRLQQYLRGVVRAAGISSLSDDAVRGEVLGRVRALKLPVTADEIEITRSPGQGRIRIEIKYAVQMHLALYQVDLHFHPGAQG